MASETLHTPQSSNVAQATYDDEARHLTVQFKNTSSTYRYSGVPEAIWHGLKRAESVGRYLHAHVKGNYPAERLA